MHNETLPQTISFSVKEAILVNNIIATCAKRGAFKVEEFKMIGTFHEGLMKRLEPYAKNEES